MTDKKLKPLLVVEDNPGLQKQLKWAFEGYQLFIAGDRASAIELLKQHNTPVVTLDLGLPPDPTNASEGLAALEEIVKILFVMLIVFPTRYIDEPIDYVIYFVTGAIGFSAFENILYLIVEATRQDVVQFLLVGNMRFLGATIIHTVTVAIVGIGLGMAYYKSFGVKLLYGVGALLFGIGLHATFNYFILLHTRQWLLVTLAAVWFVAFIVVVVTGRLKHIDRFSKPSRVPAKA